jgi:hypothetical protein
MIWPPNGLVKRLPRQAGMKQRQRRDTDLVFQRSDPDPVKMERIRNTVVLVPVR